MKFRIVFTCIFLLIFTVACFAADQGTIFIIRHAEKALLLLTRSSTPPGTGVRLPGVSVGRGEHPDDLHV